MGRRSINTTKSGKYMNPTDQARKEARKKELKKNKKQRQMVRAAVLKGKDPQQLLVDLEKIDQMEFNVLQPSPLNEKVLKDKRKKLKDTLERVLKMYSKDDPDKWAELKRANVEYDRKRTALVNYYDSVKNAQLVQIEEIPLPVHALSSELQAAFAGLPSQIPLPPQITLLRQPPGILKKNSAYSGKLQPGTVPPGIPPGPPPDLEEFERETAEDFNDTLLQQISTATPSVPQRKSIRFASNEKEDMESADVDEEAVSDNEEEDEADPSATMEPDEPENASQYKTMPTSLQQKLLAMSGQNLDQFMKEMEEVNKKKQADRAADLDARLAALDDGRDGGGHDDAKMENLVDSMPVLMNPMDMIPTGPPHLLPGLPAMLMRPGGGVPSLMGIRLPPGPPPGLPPRLNMRLPPGPPPGLPPRLLRPPNMPMVPPPPQANTNTLSAAPQLINRPDAMTPSGPTIQAQAKIRNLSADVTRFLPTSLRVKRHDQNKTKPKPTAIRGPQIEVQQPIVKPGQTKDDAYQQFMREMEGLL